MTVEELEQRGAETGLVIEYAKSSTPPLKRQPNQIPTGLDRISMKAANNIKEISGISDAMLGQESAEVSGVALQAKTQRGAVQIQTPLDNLARTRHILARRMHSLIKNFYTEHRVIQITQGNMARPEEKGEMIGINVPDPLTGEVRNNVTVGEYDVVISTQPARDTFDESQFAEALNLRNVGVAVPDDAVIEYSHLSRKRELAERVREMTGQGTPSEEQQQLAQQMQQIQMRQVELEIANSEADLENKKAQALLSTAKAQDFTSDGDDINLEIRKLEQDLLNKREERANKVKLAHIHGETNLRKAQHDSQTKIALESLKPKPNTITH
jgi:hypothetical protein